MRIVVASGKGGTGKTTVATSLALAAADSVRFMDCDVEAPNAALFLHPKLDTRKEVGIQLPVVDETLCTHCGKCAEVCEFHAIARIWEKVVPSLLESK
jgi:MinD superfamily P-loop ATPase